MDRTMPSRIVSRLVVASAATFLATVGFVGCDNTPRFDPALQYSADTLAKEFIYDYSQLKTKDEGGAVRSKVVKQTPEATKEAAKGSATTKKATSGSLDELIAETLRKAALIPGTSASDACKKVIEEVQKEPSIPEGDKKIIAEALGSGTK
jgi:hypothetical protein